MGKPRPRQNPDRHGARISDLMVFYKMGQVSALFFGIFIFGIKFTDYLVNKMLGLSCQVF